MEQLTETITLDMEEANELAFKIKVEGASTPAKVRLVCEGNDVAYMFNGRGTSEEGVVQFVIPQMREKLSEGTYSARVEVLIENRYFSPVQFQINFKKAMKVFAESVQVSPVIAKSDVKVSAVPIVVAPAARQEPRPIIVEKPIQQVRQSVDEAAAFASLKEKYASLKEAYQSRYGSISDEEPMTLARKYNKGK